MNITNLIGVHLDHFVKANNLDNDLFAHLNDQVSQQEDLQNRRNFRGHVTSSFALLDVTGTHVLMIYHLALGDWFFPGGHYEGNVSLRTSALRELQEETGFPMALVDYVDYQGYLALDVDTHLIPDRPQKDEPPHWHHDFLYLGVTLEDYPLQHQPEEVGMAQWMPLKDVQKLPDPRVRRAAKKIIKQLAQNKLDAKSKAAYM